MKKKTKDVIAKYEDACNGVALLFADTYFDTYDMDWIGDDVGGVLGINDYFFNMEDMLTFLKENATKDEVFDYYDANITAHVTGGRIGTFRYWRQSK